MRSYRVVSNDVWEIFPSSIEFGEHIGEGAFGTVFRGDISNDTCKTLPYYKLNGLQFAKKGNKNEVAVKFLKG